MLTFNELNIGDYVVHENYGIGQYKGIEKIKVEGVEKDYIKISYADNSNLYVLATQLDRLQKFAYSMLRRSRSLIRLAVQSGERPSQRFIQPLKKWLKTLLSCMPQDRE